MSKIVIIGGVAGGASAAARARRLSESAEIIVLERGEHVSFANCGLPYHISGDIEQRDALLEKLGGELAAFDTLIAHTQEEITLLKELRAATIADAVLGRVDVRSLTQKQ